MINEKTIQEAANYEQLGKIAKDLKCNRRFAKMVRKDWPYFSPNILEEYPKHSGVSWYTFLRNEALDVEVLKQNFDKYKSWLINELPKEASENSKSEAKPEPKAQPKAQPKTEASFNTPKFEGVKNENGISTGGFKLELPFNDMLQAMAKEMVPNMEQYLKGKAEEIAASMAPTVIKIGNAKEVTIEGKKHNKFEQSLKLLSVMKTLFIAGPTGSGKTYLGGQLAKALDLNFGFISCTVGMSEAHLTGRMTATGDFVSTEFLKAYEEGGVFLFDEVDAADPNVLLVINSALANGKLSVPNRKGNTIAKRHKDFHCIVAANTWGTGSFEYSGREQLDKAFLDRFNLVKVFVDYDKDLELQLTQNSEMTKKLQNIRKAKIERAISTRLIITAHKLQNVYKSDKEVFEALTIDWTIQERKEAEKHFKI